MKQLASTTCSKRSKDTSKKTENHSIRPRTLQDLKKGLYEPESRPGSASFLTPTEELLEEWLIELARRGIPVNKDYLLNRVKKILNNDPRQYSFVNNNRPGQSWFQAFLKKTPSYCATAC